MHKCFAVACILWAVFFSVPAFAACSTYPYIFSNGSTADAGQVNANFSCAAKTQGDTLDSTTFTGTTSFSGPISSSGTASAATFISSAMAKVFLSNSASQSVPNNSAVTVTGWTVGRDATGMCNASTGICTATTAGDYQVNGHLTLYGAGGVGTQLQCQLSLSGTFPATDVVMFENASTILHSCNAEAILHLTVGQTISLLAYQNSGGSLPIYVQGNTNWLNIEQLP